MAEATRPRDNPLHRGLPDEIAIWEILVRLPPKAVLRCRAVCPAWRRATSSRDFLLAHHARQPTLPLLRGHTSDSLDIIPVDHRTELAADQLQSVARLGPDYFHVEASCDGLLVLSVNFSSFCICNPATRQYAPLPILDLDLFGLSGMYPHPLTGEYRLLIYKDTYGEVQPADEFAYHVYTIGSREPPRHIGNVGIPYRWGISSCVTGTVSVLFHGNLHWYTHQMLMVFDTIAESLWQMQSPAGVYGNASPVEIDGMLGVYRLNDGATNMDIWVMQDYGSDLWTLKHRIEFPVAELTLQFGGFCNGSVVVPSRDGDVLVLVRFGDSLLQIDTAGKLVASFHRKGLAPTQLRLKQTLVPHTFFPTLEGYIVGNTVPFQ